MSVLNQLASALGRRDEVPNQELANEIVADNNKPAIDELLAALQGKNKHIQNDSIKVLYEVGAQKPEMIAGYADTFIALLQHKNNRMKWGVMTALSSIATIKKQEMYEHLPVLLEMANGDSVIARDHYVKILTILAEDEKYASDALALLLDVIKDSPVNQLASYAESAGSVITEEYKQPLKALLTEHLKSIDQESKRKRIEKVLKKL